MHKKTHVWESFLIKLQALRPVTPIQLFSCEYCEIFKKVFLFRTTSVAASGTWHQVLDFITDGSVKQGIRKYPENVKTGNYAGST